MTGKAKIPDKDLKAKAGYFNFHDVLTHVNVALDPKTVALGTTLTRNHRTRNQLQHGNAAFTVDDQHCADAILDAVQAIEHCHVGSSAVFPDMLKVSLRVVCLHSSQGNAGLRGKFEDAMRKHRWNGARCNASTTEPPVAVGVRRYWGLVMPEYAQVEIILNSLGIP